MSCTQNIPDLNWLKNLEKRIERLEQCCNQNHQNQQNQQRNNNNNNNNNNNPYLINASFSGTGEMGNPLGSLFGGLASALGVGISQVPNVLNNSIEAIKTIENKVTEKTKDLIDRIDFKPEIEALQRDVLKLNDSQKAQDNYMRVLKDLINAQDAIIRDQNKNLNELSSNYATFTKETNDTLKRRNDEIYALKGTVGNLADGLDQLSEISLDHNKAINQTITGVNKLNTKIDSINHSTSVDINNLQLQIDSIRNINNSIIKNPNNQYPTLGGTNVTPTVNTNSNVKPSITNVNSNVNAGQWTQTDFNIWKGIQEDVNDDLYKKVGKLEASLTDIGNMNQSQFTDLRDLILKDIQLDEQSLEVLKGVRVNTDEIKKKNTKVEILGNISVSAGSLAPVTQRLDAMKDQNKLDSIQLGLIGATLIAWDPLIEGNLNNVNPTSISNNLKNNFEKLKDSRALSMSLDAMNLAVNIHNAMMLSRDLGESLIFMLESCATAIGIKDMNGDAISISGMLGKNFQNMLKQIMGAENYAKISRQLAQLNRIYHASANMMNAVHDIIDSTQNIVETTAENTGKIGNALREAGVVLENAYAPMREEIDRINNVNSRFERILEKIEQTEQVVNAIDSVASDVVSIQSSIQEFKQNKIEFKQALTEFENEQLKQYNEAKLNYESSVQFESIDVSRLGQ